MGLWTKEHFYLIMPSFVIFIALAVLLGKALKNKSEKTNIDALIGEIGFVEEEIPMYKPGRVSVKGMSWKAVSDTPLSKGDMVRVLEVNGVTVKCEKASKQTKFRQYGEGRNGGIVCFTV